MRSGEQDAAGHSPAHGHREPRHRQHHNSSLLRDLLGETAVELSDFAVELAVFVENLLSSFPILLSSSPIFIETSLSQIHKLRATELSVYLIELRGSLWTAP